VNQSGEVGDYHGSNSGIPAAVHVEPGQTVTVETIIIAGKLPEKPATLYHLPI